MVINTPEDAHSHADSYHDPALRSGLSGAVLYDDGRSRCRGRRHRILVAARIRRQSLARLRSAVSCRSRAIHDSRAYGSQLPAAKFRQQRSKPACVAMSVCAPSPRRFKILKALVPSGPAQFESFGLKTVGDLLHHLPFRYDDRRQIKKIAQAVAGEEASFVGMPGGFTKKICTAAAAPDDFGDASRRQRAASI